MHLALVVQKVDNAIPWINHYPADSVVSLLTLFHWIVVFPVDSFTQDTRNTARVLASFSTSLVMYEKSVRGPFKMA